MQVQRRGIPTSQGIIMPPPTASSGEACPACGAHAGTPASCPLFPAWGLDAKMRYFFEAVKASAPRVDPEVSRFWDAAITHHLARRTHSLVFTGEEVMLAYTRQGVLRALCLPRILQEADARQETCPAATLLETTNGSSPSMLRQTSRRLSGAGLGVVKWVAQTLVVTPAKAAWSYAIGHDDMYDDDEDDEDEAHAPSRATVRAMKTPRVHLGLCAAAAKLLTAYVANRIDAERTVSLGMLGDEEHEPSKASSSTGACSFQQVCRLAAAAAAAAPASNPAAGILQTAAAQDCEVLANYMVQQGLAARDGSYLKILGGQGQRGKALTEADKKVCEFRLRVGKLERILAQREGDMAQAKQRAVTLHKQGLSAQAAVEMARYKKLQALVGKLRGALLNLLSIHYSIEGVATDLEIFVGLKGGNEALKEQQAAARAGGLGTVMDVEEALLEAQELIAETQEVGAALAQPSLEAVGDDDADLLQELAALEIAVEKKKEEALELPDVSHLPPPVASSSSTKAEKAPTAGKVALQS